MTPDWTQACELATSFHVEVCVKDLWLVKHDGSMVDAVVRCGGRVLNIPFRPHILCAKAGTKDKDLVEKFTAASQRWRLRYDERI